MNEKTCRPYKEKINDLRIIMTKLVEEIDQELEKTTESSRAKKQQTLF